MTTDHSHKPIEEIDQEIIKTLIDLLFFQYPKAREAIIAFESHTDEAPIFAFTELRDFIDHMNLALHQDLSSDSIPHHLAQAEEHLRRAVAEPYQGMIQEEKKQIKKLFTIYEKRWFKKLPFVTSKVIQLQEYYDKKREINDLLSKGRTLKACNIWSADFDKAIQDCFLPALIKCISLREILIQSLQVTKERVEKIVISFISAFIIFVCINVLVFLIGCIQNLFN